MCIRFCFGSWELRSSTQYPVLRKTKEQRHCTPSRDSPAVPGAGNPLTKQIEEFTNLYSFLFGCMRSWCPTLSQRARKDGTPVWR
jgi:hypothetical protein